MDEPAYEVVEFDHPGFDYQIYVDDVIAHLRPELMDELTADLAAHPDVARADHEDREKIIVGSRRKLFRRRLGAANLEAWLAEWFGRFDESELYPQPGSPRSAS